MERLKKVLKKKGLLSIYFTAGFPNLNDTADIIYELDRNGADLIEIGIPFSDPLADGPVIQQSSKTAIENGMTLKLLFKQLKDIRKDVDIPLILMGYFNSILQFGVEDFCKNCALAGIDGLIIPDLPLDVYKEEYEAMFAQYGLSNILLVTPSTSAERLTKIDKESSSFIYYVSANSTTGNKNGVRTGNAEYFDSIRNIKHPVLIGFGIKDKQSFQNACQYSNGAIIGTAFINAIANTKNLSKSIKEFIQSIKN